MKVKMLVPQPCPTRCDLMEFSPPGVACQAPLSMGLSRTEYWSGVPFPSPEDLPNPGIELVSPVLAGMFFTISTTWEASHVHFYSNTVFQFHNRNVWLLLLWNRLTGLFL